jgi:hypothetical protein
MATETLNGFVFEDDGTVTDVEAEDTVTEGAGETDA